jgi:hypothetical protein
LNIFFCWSHIVILSISTNCPWYWKSSVIVKSNSFWRYWWKQWRQFCRSRCDNIDYVCLIRHRWVKWLNRYQYIYIQWNLFNPTHQGTREMYRILQDVGILKFSLC